MKLEIEHSIGDRFFYLTAGVIHEAIITTIETRDQFNSIDHIFDLAESEPTQRTIVYSFRYRKPSTTGGYIYSDGSTHNADILYKQKKDAARKFLIDAGLEPALTEIEC